MTTKPYRPSNGTEGEMFMERFCDRCAIDGEHPQGCEILAASFAFDPRDERYPKEWVRGADGWGTCTAFNEKGAGR